MPMALFIPFVGTQSQNSSQLFPQLTLCFLATLSATGGRSLKLLCAAEIDCILANGHEYIELKTQQFGRFGEHFPVRNKGFQFKGFIYIIRVFSFFRVNIQIVN